MNALQSYSSDDESGNEAPMHKKSRIAAALGDRCILSKKIGGKELVLPDLSSCRMTRKNADPGTNYDDVGMDISEDSDDEPAHHNQQKERGSVRPTSNSTRPPGVSPPGSSPAPSPLPSTNNDGHKYHSEAKEGPRSSHTSPSQDREGHSRRKSKSKSPNLKSPKAKSPRPRSPAGGNKHSRKTRSRSKSREREGRSSQQGREHSGRSHASRDQVSQGHSVRGKDSREGRRSRDDDRKRRDEERRSRRSRSRSRSRERRRSRSRSRDRRSRSRSRDRRRRSRSRERKRPMDIRKEAQQKLALLKAANPDLTAAELLKRSMEAQMVEVQKQTGIALPSYYNPAAMNPMKFAEQERKKKLLWGNKNKPPETPLPSSTPAVTETVSIAPSIPRPSGSGIGGIGTGVNTWRPPLGSGSAAAATAAAGSTCPSGGQAALWANTRFSNDRDGKMAEKFRRLMGVKSATETPPAGNKEIAVAPSSARESPGVDIMQKQETMFTSMERQYEMARIATHTHKGFGLGFTSQSFMPK
ncbi:arginine/serine-rich coiled-coil protein 2 isoform X2 [Procambarus clarkii]|uniref:arginine/serine-rich coiled-coil protein 2 isoform X2 n=1 Tax=Procambarus clarkii TaxID=6728 RepID=UPI001E66FE14|nr:arginine/serine-rich coiled-coil protein 2-like isoform X2 [Procambarus clarkii]